MRVIGEPGSSELPSNIEGTVATVGTFDGVHCGHQDVLGRLKRRAAASGRPSLLVTFEPHPLEVLNPEAAPALLTTRDEKLALLEQSALDIVAIVQFTAELAQRSATEFVEEVLLGRFRMAELLLGHDHGFGRGRAGDINLLRTLGDARGFAVDAVPPVLTDTGEPVSSTLVRRAVATGALERARGLLGRWYSVQGQVVAGEARGRLLGFPTL